MEGNNKKVSDFKMEKSVKEMKQYMTEFLQEIDMIDAFFISKLQEYVGNFVEL